MTRKTFLGLLREQIKILQSGDYEYTALHIYTAGMSYPWIFRNEDQYKIDEDNGYLVYRDGPTAEYNNEGVPEYLIRIDAIVGTQLV